jgi:hypothetical protein
VASSREFIALEGEELLEDGRYMDILEAIINRYMKDDEVKLNY